MSNALTAIAAEQQRHFDSSTSPEVRKERGHFGTPPVIAEFMAGLFSEIPQGTVRILDPGAGVGTLSAAVCQRVCSLKSPRQLEFELFENDPKLIPLLERTMSSCKQQLRNAGHDLKFVIRVEDFVLANPKNLLAELSVKPSFHLAILNPPYFKLRKESPQAAAMEHLVHGQPNIYPFFMAAAADLLLPGGELVAITPRSYFNGPYFRRFRNWFFARMAARHIHLFESRSEAFKDDAVLQENVILLAAKSTARRDVVISTSSGRELTAVERNTVGYDQIVDGTNGDSIIRVSTNRFDHDLVAAMDQLPNRFRDLGLEISTGPVVTFRSTEFLRNERSANTAPLLWMHNVRPFITQFPPKNGKPTHIVVNDASRRLLVPAKNYVLLKRFTAKEEKRRIVAGIMKAKDSYSEWVGLENHLNYVYRRGAELSSAETYGLAAYLNSALVDRYFRAISGNTQVNATEIRVLPVPDQATLCRIGEDVRRLKMMDRGKVEQIVGRAVRLPRSIIGQLSEVA